MHVGSTVRGDYGHMHIGRTSCIDAGRAWGDVAEVRSPKVASKFPQAERGLDGPCTGSE